MSGSVKVQILGPLRVWRDRTELSPGPRQQAQLLAVLAARAGRPVSTSELIDMVWDVDVPTSAMNTVHKYVGSLRRLLEPDLPVRAAGAYLHRHGPGYLFVGGGEVVDVAAFRATLAAARAHLGGPDARPQEALSAYLEAVELWEGRAGGGLLTAPLATPIFIQLDEEFFGACTEAAELARGSGCPEAMVSPLRLAARMAPLNETVHASLVSTLVASGHRAEAVAVFQTVRTQLAEELGIEPGPALRAARHEIAAAPAGTVASRESSAPSAQTMRGGLVGRRGVIAALRAVVEPAYDGGSGLAVVEGEQGTGKTRILEELAREAEAHGARPVWCPCRLDRRTRPLWPWAQAVRSLQETNSASLPSLEMGGAWFDMFEQVADLIDRAAARQPLLVLVDDVHWADRPSLELLRHVITRLPVNVALVCAVRDKAPTPTRDVVRLLASASQLAHHRRIELAPLTSVEVAELVLSDTGVRLDEPALEQMCARTGGRPLLVRELARVVTGAQAQDGLPRTVQDLVRDRTGDLEARTVMLLQLAAHLSGRVEGPVDTAYLGRLARLDHQSCLDHLDRLESLGLLEHVSPRSVDFPVGLFRESVAAGTPRGVAAGLQRLFAAPGSAVATPGGLESLRSPLAVG
jgi:DNA-binding SARP family transcriptional activator